MWYNGGMNTSDWINLIAAVLIGAGTLFLGIMAWRTIRQTRTIQKAETRERLLNEIIDWAEDVAKRTIESNLATDDVEMTEIPKRQLRRLLSQYMTLDSKSEYIACVAKSFGSEVIDTVKDTRNDLTLAQYLIAQLSDLEEIHTKLVQQSPFLRDMLDKRRGALERNSLANAAYSLRESAINLMTKTAHIKIQLIQT